MPAQLRQNDTGPKLIRQRAITIKYSYGNPACLEMPIVYTRLLSNRLKPIVSNGKVAGTLQAPTRYAMADSALGYQLNVKLSSETSSWAFTPISSG